VGDQEVVDCFDARTGRDEWQSGYPTHYRDDFGFDEGPRGTPTVVSNRVYTYGAEGMLGCWDASDGRKVWSADTKSQFRQSKGFFGMACSPLIEGDLVVLNVGGKGGAGLVAFDRSTGKVRWKASDDEASYASPVAATVAGSRRVFAITREALISVNPLDGSVAFRYPWRPSMDASVSAATPLVIDDQIFISASYGTGATLLRLRGNRPEKVWSSDESLSNHYATSVHRDGLLFGFDGRQEHGCDLRCVELQSGKVRWSEGGLAEGTPRDDLKLPELPALSATAEVATPPYRPEPLGGARAHADDYRCFLVDAKLPAESYLTGYEVLPGTPAMIHHVARLFILSSWLLRFPETGAIIRPAEGPCAGCDEAAKSFLSSCSHPLSPPRS